MDNKNIFAERMKEARLKADLSQAELSRRTKISAATLSTYESTENPKNPPIDKAIAIAQELNVSLDWMCGLSSEHTAEDTHNELTVEKVINAIITLSKLSDCNINTYFSDFDGTKSLSIGITNKELYDFCNEYKKIMDFMINPDYPDYLKTGLKNALLNKFINSCCVVNGFFINKEEIIDGDDAPF